MYCAYLNSPTVCKLEYIYKKPIAVLCSLETVQNMLINRFNIPLSFYNYIFFLFKSTMHGQYRLTENFMNSFS